jgi:hypothetical protein
MVATKHGREAVVQFLLSRGADCLQAANDVSSFPNRSALKLAAPDMNRSENVWYRVRTP